MGKTTTATAAATTADQAATTDTATTDTAATATTGPAGPSAPPHRHAAAMQGRVRDSAGLYDVGCSTLALTDVEAERLGALVAPTADAT